MGFQFFQVGRDIMYINDKVMKLRIDGHKFKDTFSNKA